MIQRSPNSLRSLGLSHDNKAAQHRSIDIHPLSTSHSYLPSTLLPRIPNGVILASPDLRLLLADNVLHKDFTCVFRLVLPDPARIPEFTRNTEVLAASHQRIGSTSLRSRGNTIGGEVILLTTGDGDKSEETELLAWDTQ
jgi:hypothetical protein